MGLALDRIDGRSMWGENIARTSLGLVLDRIDGRSRWDVNIGSTTMEFLSEWWVGFRCTSDGRTTLEFLSG